MKNKKSIIRKRLILMSLIILIIMGCELYKNPADSNPKIFGIIMGDGKMLPRKPVSDAKVYYYAQDSLVAISISDVSGYFHYDNLQVGHYRLEIEKEYEFKNYAYTSLNIEFNDEQDLGTIFLNHVHEDYFPIKIGSKWVYDCLHYSNDWWGGNSERFKLSIAIQDTRSREDTMYYNIQCSKETYFRDWRHEGSESTNTDIIVEQWQDQLKEFNGYIKSLNLTILSDKFVGFHILTDLAEFLETTGFADKEFLGNNVPQIKQQDFESVGGKMYRSLVIKALNRYLDREKQIVLSPNYGVIAMKTVTFGGGGLSCYLEEYTP